MHWGQLRIHRKSQVGGRVSSKVKVLSHPSSNNGRSIRDAISQHTIPEPSKIGKVDADECMIGIEYHETLQRKTSRR